MWYELDSGIFHGKPGIWSATVLCGTWMSNTHTFRIVIPQPNRPSAASGKSDEPRVLGDMEFLRTPNHPEPRAPGVTFRISDNQDKSKAPLLFGSFAIPEGDPNVGVTLNAFVSGTDTKDIRHWVIRVPRTKVDSIGGVLKGHFTLDLKRHMGNPKLENFELPSGCFITFSSGQWSGVPQEMETNPKR